MPRADLGCYVLANSGMVHVFKMINISHGLFRSFFCEGIFIVSITENTIGRVQCHAIKKKHHRVDKVKKRLTFRGV